MFYAGGANSIRAFPVRSIGPGAFPGLGGNNQFSYVLQNGDMKIVANLELRQRLFGNLYGALFLDAGNVWNSRDWSITTSDLDDSQQGDDLDYMVDTWNTHFAHNNFRLRNFFKQIATGTGFGLRYDLDFLVLRLDWGFGLHLPYDTGKSGYFNIRRFKDMHTLHIAIGYPF
jgi:outer membrane protein assembly factor BamA